MCSFVNTVTLQSAGSTNLVLKCFWLKSSFWLCWVRGGREVLGVVTPNLRSRGREMSLPLFRNQETLLSGGTLTLQLTCAI